MSDDRQDTAEELALLTMLQDKVAEQIRARKAVIEETWTGGSKVEVEMPNPDNPARPIKVGIIRADGGQGVARIADAEAWQAWCIENVPHNVVQQPESMLSWVLDAASLEALDEFVSVWMKHGGFGVDPTDRARAALDALEAAGYTLAKRTKIPAKTLVMPAWEGETLKLTQQAGTPVTPGGLIPEGVEFDPKGAPVKPVVTIKKEEPMRAAFVAAQRHRLPEITGSIIDPKETP